MKKQQFNHFLDLIKAMIILTTIISKFPSTNGFIGTKISSSLLFVHTSKRSHYFHRIVAPSSCNNINRVFKNSLSSTILPSEAKAKRYKIKQNRIERYEHNLKIQQWLESSAAEDIVSIRVMTMDDDDTTQTIKLKNKRIFFRLNDEKDITLEDVSNELHKSFIGNYKKDGLEIQMSLPTIVNEAMMNTEYKWRNITTNEQLKEMIHEAVEYYFDNKDTIKRPSLLLQVNARLLNDTATREIKLKKDPKETESMTMLSFYSFPPNGGIKDPIEFRNELKRQWRPYHVLGRVYVAREGVNAQMAVPTNILPYFMECCRNIKELGEYMENGINIDPNVIPIKDFNEQKPFQALHIRIRHQIVSDGLDTELDWSSAGYDMPPSEWHATLSNDKKPLLFDCRNDYETSIGKFQDAIPLETKHFRETWDVLADKLQDVPKDTPIMTYCTGGIRCVKVGAYLTQVMNFTNVSRLAGGIIAYDRQMNDSYNETTLFQGSNYVFDNRIGRPITNDALATCVTCGCQTSFISNCQNPHCHIRITQCPTCSQSYHGTCSSSCRNRLLNSQLFQAKYNKRLISDEPMPNEDKKYFNDIEEYSAFYSTAKDDSLTSTIANAALGCSDTTPSPILSQIEQSTKQYMPTGSHMLSGPTQGTILHKIASLTTNGRILELGTFTGYSTFCLLQGASNANAENPLVVSLERDPRAFDIAAMHFDTIQQVGNDEEAICKEIQNVHELYPTQVPEFEDDNITISYKNVQCKLSQVKDGLATLEEMSQQNQQPFDLVFLDADKPRLLEYIETLVTNDSLLTKDGIIIVDNTLWKGLVLEACHGYTKKKNVQDDDDSKKSRRARRLALIMHRFNEQMKIDDRVDVKLVPLRDGLTIIRKL